MTRKEKLLIKIIENPQSLKYPQIRKLLNKLGFVQKNIRGSHHKFRHPQLEQILSIPVHNNDCKEFYKVKISVIIKNNFL
ncbi:type II toxin-antitoxin system HicA family toxin [Candidatus Peregrinibacteria bacterium]|jgi:predicted RNA binding protein YcfA (HicA-like mRNA interferase family)|nr:type II toxin-antitoxin system HicA family toxin [Candidatus Peregrinibacteria bacterium]MBT4056359.1 type II toxin-antitoxin system HicA family toxin [Candidatus Peregrinibacteria bacterium]